jgi:FKBP-type peptidyl-prolyl cis-trans isomerase
MSRIVYFAAAVVLAWTLSAAAADPPTRTEDQETLYEVGRLLARSLAEFELSPEEFAQVVSGLNDGVTGKGEELNVDEASKRVQAYLRTRQAASQKAAGAEFAKQQEGEPGAVKNDSGMIYRELAPGEGASPALDDTVEVHYTGTLIDGTVFDSSVQRGQPATFQLKGVIPCFREGIQAMKPGGKARLVCPSDIAYGDTGAGSGIKPGATLVFEVELLRIVK